LKTTTASSLSIRNNQCAVRCTFLSQFLRSIIRGSNRLIEIKRFPKTLYRQPRLQALFAEHIRIVPVHAQFVPPDDVLGAIAVCEQTANHFSIQKLCRFLSFLHAGRLPEFVK
jgi:hypothetical protein